MPAPTLLPLTAALTALAPFEQTFMVSAATGDGIEQLADALADAVPEGPHLYPDDDLTDLPDRLLAAEIVREQIFLQTHEEVPYGTTVETENWQERNDGSVRIEATVYVARPGHKAILIGEGGQRIKTIGARAREELASAAGAQGASVPQREAARRLGRGSGAAARDRVAGPGVARFQVDLNHANSLPLVPVMVGESRPTTSSLRASCLGVLPDFLHHGGAMPP